MTKASYQRVMTALDALALYTIDRCAGERQRRQAEQLKRAVVDEIDALLARVSAPEPALRERDEELRRQIAEREPWVRRCGGER